MKKKKMKREVTHLYKLLAKQAVLNVKLQRDLTALQQTQKTDSAVVIQA